MKLILVFAIAVFVFSNASYADRGSNLPALPFEKFHTDTSYGPEALKFNDFSGKIESSRIKKLLRSGNVLGDRVLLKNNNAVYFPKGYIVSSSLKLEQWRPKAGVNPRQIFSINDVEPNPDFEFVYRMDKYLGEICAQIPTRDHRETLNLRKSPDGVYSLVKRTTGRLDRIVGEPTEEVEVTSAMKPHFISTDIKIQRFAQNCI